MEYCEKTAVELCFTLFCFRFLLKEERKGTKKQKLKKMEVDEESDSDIYRCVINILTCAQVWKGSSLLCTVCHINHLTCLQVCYYIRDILVSYLSCRRHTFSLVCMITQKRFHRFHSCLAHTCIWVRGGALL